MPPEPAQGRGLLRQVIKLPPPAALLAEKIKAKLGQVGSKLVR